MESLQVTRLLSCKSFLNTAANAGTTHSRPTTQLGFPPLSENTTKKGCLMIRRSFTNGSSGSGGGSGGTDVGSGNISSQDSSSPPVEDEKDENIPGFLLGQEMDGSGSVIGFHLIPPSSMFILLCFQFCNL